MKKFTLLISAMLKRFALLWFALLPGQFLLAGTTDGVRVDITVRGRVTDKDGPLAGVTVTVQLVPEPLSTGVFPLPQAMQLVRIVDDELKTAPPWKKPVFPPKLQLVIVRIEDELYTPPP